MMKSFPECSFTAILHSFNGVQMHFIRTAVWCSFISFNSWKLCITHLLTLRSFTKFYIPTYSFDHRCVLVLYIYVQRCPLKSLIIRFIYLHPIIKIHPRTYVISHVINVGLSPSGIEQRKPFGAVHLQHGAQNTESVSPWLQIGRHCPERHHYALRG